MQQVADALKPHGLTLANYASIREQQIGGFTQVGTLCFTRSWVRGWEFCVCMRASACICSP